MNDKNAMILVSSCLCEIRCRYDCRRLRKRQIIKKLKNIVPVCPEQLGGLPTPRPKSKIINGTGRDVLSRKALVFNETGEDVTKSFIRGAREVLRIIRMFNIKKAYFKTRSPSCGKDGVTTALLNRFQIKIHFVE